MTVVGQAAKVSLWSAYQRRGWVNFSFHVRPSHRSAEPKHTCPHNILFLPSALIAAIGVLSIRHEARHARMAAHLGLGAVAPRGICPVGGNSEGFCQDFQ